HLGLCPECPRDKRYYDSRDNFMDYEPTSYVSPNLNGNSWVHSIGRNSRVYERYQMWSDARTLGLDEYAQKYGEAYTNMNAYWRYYEEEQIANGVKVKRPQLILSGRASRGYFPLERTYVGPGSPQSSRGAQGLDAFQGTGRPDEDGYITFWEARDHYRNGGGTSLYADLGGLDLSKISANDFPEGIGSSNVFNLDQKYFANANDAAVFGSISLRLVDQNTVVAMRAFDIYDFDIKPWSSQTFIRNVATMGANAIHGSGQSFVIWIYGQGKIGK
ncbi:MAG: hypothetical protein AAGI25_20570, partial [Bacteroidota bacterium]